MNYREYLKSEDWINKRYQKRLRQNRCAICASTENLDIHHLNYKNLVDVSMDDLRVLCRRCHFLAHDLHKAGKLKFRNTNANSRYTLLKLAVKKELGITKKNMFRINR